MRDGGHVRGPASLLYGSSALGGVVNVIGTDIPTAVPSHLEGYFAGQGISVTPGGAATVSRCANGFSVTSIC